MRRVRRSRSIVPRIVFTRIAFSPVAFSLALLSAAAMADAAPRHLPMADVAGMSDPSGELSRPTRHVAADRIRQAQAGGDVPLVDGGAAVPVLPDDGGYATVAETSLHTEPSASGKALAVLAPGTALRLTGVVSDRPWLRVTDPRGTEGFVSAHRVVEVAEREWRAWTAIGESVDGAALRRFLLSYPGGPFAPVAQARLAGVGARGPGDGAGGGAAGGGPGSGMAAGPGSSLDDLSGRRPPASGLDDLGGLPQRPGFPARPDAARPDLARPDPLAREPGEPGTAFRECAACPEMVVVPAGSFVMGPAADDPVTVTDEMPRRRVVLHQPFAVGRFTVTVGEYAVFAEAEGQARMAGCSVLGPGGFVESAQASWHDPGYPQGDRHPVACVSWEDAGRYADWLSERTGARYRLPSEAEWDYVARGGATGILPWEEGMAGLCRQANIADRAFARRLSVAAPVDCLDGHAYASPVGSFPPNGFGLHDVVGNVYEWTADCWHASYAGAPGDARIWTEGGDCSTRVTRGASWASSDPDFLRLSRRTVDPAGLRLQIIGFRVVRELD